MLSFKDTRDFLLLSYHMKLITDDEFGLLFDTYSSPNLDLRYDSFPPFDLSQLNEDKCSEQFFSVSENRILFIVFSMSAFFDTVEVI